MSFDALQFEPWSKCTFSHSGRELVECTKIYQQNSNDLKYQPEMVAHRRNMQPEAVNGAYTPLAQTMRDIHTDASERAFFCSPGIHKSLFGRFSKNNRRTGLPPRRGGR